MDLDELSKLPHPLVNLIRGKTLTTPFLAVDNTYELGGSDDERERAQNAVLIEQLERKKRMRRMAVPTDDKKVRERLRAYGEPITLFGEGVSYLISSPGFIVDVADVSVAGVARR